MLKHLYINYIKYKINVILFLYNVLNILNIVITYTHTYIYISVA
jgi:hypothetical protein